VLSLKACGPQRKGHWSIDASYTVHEDMKGQNGATFSLGEGGIYSCSSKQRARLRVSLWRCRTHCHRCCGQSTSLRHRGHHLPITFCTRTSEARSFWKTMDDGQAANVHGTSTSDISSSQIELQTRSYELSTVLPKTCSLEGIIVHQAVPTNNAHCRKKYIGRMSQFVRLVSFPECCWLQRLRLLFPLVVEGYIRLRKPTIQDDT